MKKLNKKILIPTLAAGMAFVSLAGCGPFGGSSDDSQSETTVESTVSESVADVDNEGAEEKEKETTTAAQETEIQGLESDREIPVEKAEYFTLDSYKDGYYVINIHRNKFSQRVLVVPEGKETPEGTGKDVVVVKQPVTSSRIDSVSMMDLLEHIQPELLDNITLTATRKEKMKIDRVAQNMESGKTEYAGTAKEPDVELVKSKAPGVYLALSSLPSQDAYGKLKEAGINPVITFYNQETDPFGRLEWIKMLGAFYGNMEGAEAYYNGQKAVYEAVDASKAGSRSYIMFCLSKKKNTAYVRRTNDAIAKMGERAGGKNALSDSEKGGWEEMSLADFVEKYKDTDCLIYMTDHGDNVDSIKSLTDISEGMADFKAVKENNIWKTSKDYSLMNNCGDMIKDLNAIFAGDAGAEGSANFVHVKE